MTRAAPSRSRDIADQLRRDILAGRIKRGDRLPTTRAMAEQFAVSLPTVQTVLRQLETQGLIECRARQSSIVTGNSLDRAVAKRTTIAVIRKAFRDEDAQFDNRINRILRCAEQVLSPHGYHLTTFTHAGQEQSVIDECLPKLEDEGDRLAGVLCCSRAAPEVMAEQMPSRGVPWLTIDRSSERIEHNYITADDLDGGRRIGYYFAKSGFRRVLFLSLDVRTAMRGMDLLSGLFQGYLQAGAAPPQIDSPGFEDYSVEIGKQHTLTYIDEHGVPDAVLSPGDYLSIGAMQAFHERGIEIPGRVAVVGGAGLELSNYCHPQLTVMRQPMEAIGRAAGETMIHMIETPGEACVPGQTLSCDFIVRQSFIVTDQLLGELNSPGPIALGRDQIVKR